MIKKNSFQHLISSSYLNEVFHKLNKMNAKPVPIMVECLIRRVICEIDQEAFHNSETKHHPTIVTNELDTNTQPEDSILESSLIYDDDPWIRILEGDIDYIGDTQRASLTYSTKENYIKKDIYMLKIDNIDDAIHVAEKMGYSAKSFQESIRTKFRCSYNGAEYTVRFDKWPLIEEYTIIEIDSLSKYKNVKALINELKIITHEEKLLKQINFEKKSKSIDIDELYRIFTLPQTKASQISYISFELGLGEDRFGNKIKKNDIVSESTQLSDKSNNNTKIYTPTKVVNNAFSSDD